MTKTDMGKQRRVGIALGGGVVRGLAHIGVLSSLVEARVPIDCAAGTSVGALVGALFCAGLDVAEIEYIASKVGWRSLARPVWPGRGILSFDGLESALVSLLGDISFADLELPFATVTTDLENGREVVLREGRVAPAVRASCSVPGFVEPSRLGGRLLGDGGIVNNVPASVVRSLGADFVIGVDVFEPSFTRGWGPIGLGAAALELLVARAGHGHGEADCLIRPALSGRSFFSFAQLETLIRLGREATEAALPEIRCAVSDRR